MLPHGDRRSSRRTRAGLSDNAGRMAWEARDEGRDRTIELPDGG
jgi:hypothetical protein